MMKYYIYILISEIRINWSYVGHTDKVDRRYKEHAAGKVRSTKGMRPLKLVHLEEYNSRDDAIKRERYLKSGQGREEKELIITKNIK